MRRATRPNAKKEALSRQQLFIESISSLFADEFHEFWIPVFAQTCYRISQKAPIDKKANVMEQALGHLSVWIEGLRIRLLRDLARFVQNNQTDFNGNAKHWMERCCNEIWSLVVSEEAYLEWFAAACDNMDDLEAWRAPVWLADTLGICQKSLRLQEKPEQAEVVVLSRHRTAELDDCDRLNADSTDKLVSYAFQLNSVDVWGASQQKKARKLICCSYFFFNAPNCRLGSTTTQNHHLSRRAAWHQCSSYVREAEETAARFLQRKVSASEKFARLSRMAIKGWSTAGNLI